MFENRKITITADDFGISKIATKNILELTRSGKLDRVEVMMSKNITPEQARELLDSGVKIDIHFHLKSDILGEWQDRKEEFKEGNIKRILFFIWDYFFSRDRVGETEAEWYFQLSDFKKLFGRYPDGLSSHEHIHFFPAYFKIIMEIAAQNNIAFVRFGKNNYPNYNPVSLILNFLRFFNRGYYKKLQNKIKTTDFFVSFDWIKANKKPLNLLPKNKSRTFLQNIKLRRKNLLNPSILAENQGTLRKVRDKEVEVVFHPERDDEYEFLKAIDSVFLSGDRPAERQN